MFSLLVESPSLLSLTVCSYINIELPADAKKNGVRIRWWQPHNPGHLRGDWAIDDINIGGKVSNPEELRDEFRERRNDFIWLQRSNTRHAGYCGAPSAVVGDLHDKETVVLMTSDIAVHYNFIAQFSISVGCNASWNADLNPVHFEYSTDYGVSWRVTVDECLPFSQNCDGVGTLPSIYYSAPGWRRVTIPLDGPVVSKYEIFRSFFKQYGIFSNHLIISSEY